MLKTFLLLASFSAFLAEAKHHEEHDPCTYKANGQKVKKKRCKKLAKKEGWAQYEHCIWNKTVKLCVTEQTEEPEIEEQTPAPEATSDATMGGSEAAAMAQLLTGAIRRGVPMYNKGQHEACAMIYETALHSVIIGPGWGLQADERTTLEEGFNSAQDMTSNSDKAWAYRRLMNALLAPRQAALAGHSAAEASNHNNTPQNMMTLFDFDSPTDASSWDVVLDGVMGGLSTGYIRVRDGKMVFYGKTSLENNGGFSSVRTRVAPGALTGMNKLRLRVRGDGRTYILGTSDGGFMGSYWHEFETRDGEWMTVDAVINEMQKHWFGVPMSGRIQPSQVRQVELYVYDKKAGPFELVVDSIEAMA